MSKPKRHHWWPVVQSKHWTDPAGLVNVVKSDGSYFRTSPLNIGVESELYTRFLEDDEKDSSVEEWFAETIDSPCKQMIEYLLDPRNTRRSHFDHDRSDKRDLVNRLGFRTSNYIDCVPLGRDLRKSMSQYIAALIVRNPKYLAKIKNFYIQRAFNGPLKNITIDTMIDVYEMYQQKIESADYLLVKSVGNSEFLYADGGIQVREPWSNDGAAPFDIHAPLLPELSIEVFPMRIGAQFGEMFVCEAKNDAVARQNRIILQGASRFVFCRQNPPTAYIKKYFGTPAPKQYGHRIVDGRLETQYDHTFR